MSQRTLLSNRAHVSAMDASPFTSDGNWKESDHPRKGGKFAPKGTGTTGKSTKKDGKGKTDGGSYLEKTAKKKLSQFTAKAAKCKSANEIRQLANYYCVEQPSAITKPIRAKMRELMEAKKAR